MYETKTKPKKCIDCTFSHAHSTTFDGYLIGLCKKLYGQPNNHADESVLENCPLPDENIGKSEEEYTTIRE